MNNQTGVLLVAGVFVVAAVAGTTAMSASASPVSASRSVSVPVGLDESPSAVPTPLPSATPSDPAPTPTASPVPSVISADQARVIALAASGGGTITKFELKDEHSDKPEYRVEIQNGRVRHKLRIDGFTGEITRHDVN